MAAFEDTKPGVKQNTPLSINRVEPLTHLEQMDLITLSSDNRLNVLWKLMELIIIEQRDIAMDVPPNEREKQFAEMTIAHAYNKFYTRIRSSIKYNIDEHLGRLRQLQNEKITELPEEIEKIVLDQTQNFQQF